MTKIIKISIVADMPIFKYPEPILRKTAKTISVFNDELKQLAQDMVAEMYKSDGVGLAAPQVGISQRLIVVNHGKEARVYINPEITYFSPDKKVGEEGCLSLPNIFGLVKRSKKIHLKYQDINGQVIREKIKGLDSIILQHEVDHLNGILFIDRAEKIVKGQDILDSLQNE